VNPNWYDLLDVDRDASADEIRAAWKTAIADLDPTDRRFRVRNQAAEVLLDPARRASYDAELDAAEVAEAAEAAPEDAPGEASGEPTPPAPTPAATSAASGSAVTELGGALWSPPGWLLAGVAIVTALVVGAAAFTATRPADESVEDATREAQSAAERAVVPVLSYDYRTLEEDQAAAQAVMTSDYKAEYDKLFNLISENAPNTQTAVEVEVIASGIVRSGEDRVQILVFVNRPTTNKAQKEPVVYKDQATLTMQLVDGTWLVDDLVSSPVAE
jgi:Mce-associated membrane protein